MSRRDRLMRELARLATESLEQTGVTWRDLSLIEEEKTRIVIPALPLFTEEALGGRMLEGFIAVDTPVDKDDFIQAYEEYVAYYVESGLKRGSPDTDIANALKLSKRDTLALFGRGPGRPKASVRDRMLTTFGFVALAHYNYAAAVTSERSSLIATFDHGGRSYRFGVEDSAVITNYGKCRVETGHTLMHPRGLLHLTRSHGATVRKPTTLTLLWAWLNKASTAKRHPEKEALKLALAILFWRAGKRDIGRMSDAVRESAAPESWDRAISMGRSFMDFPDPYKELFQIFVPNLLTKREFVKVFGERPRRVGTPNQARQRLWRVSLDYLYNKNVGDTQ